MVYLDSIHCHEYCVKLVIVTCTLTIQSLILYPPPHTPPLLKLSS